MPSAAALRLEIERKLERRFPAALSPVPRTIYEVCETGVAAVDRLLGGGLPVGAISELTGPAASGRTSLALAFVAGRTQEDRSCAWVDVSDAFDPQSAAANGVRLRQLLWIRCKGRGQATPVSKNRSPGTPAGDKGTRERGSKGAREPAGNQPQRSWTQLDQALRATDLLLQAGGFAAIVLDLGDTAPEQANRIPAATWFRYRQAAERTQCSVVVLGKRAYAQSAAEVVLECEAGTCGAADFWPSEEGGTVLRGFAYAVRRGRERFAPVDIGTRKPPAATWEAEAMWDAERSSFHSSRMDRHSPVTKSEGPGAPNAVPNQAEKRA